MGVEVNPLSEVLVSTLSPGSPELLYCRMSRAATILLNGVGWMIQQLTVLIFVDMAFAIKWQTKAATAFKGNFGAYGPILLKLCLEVAFATYERLVHKRQLPLDTASAFVRPLIAKPT